MRIEVSQVIDRPVADVFRWYADDHVRNHPRWNPELELEQISDGPIGIGTVIRRRNTMGDTPIEGTMEVVEYEPNQAMGAVIREGPAEIYGRATFEAEGEGRTRLTISADIPAMDESADTSRITALMQRSALNIKQLVESEV
jgi:uncharacterized protein YndB with AHSA1/START domain